MRCVQFMCVTFAVALYVMYMGWSRQIGNPHTFASATPPCRMHCIAYITRTQNWTKIQTIIIRNARNISNHHYQSLVIRISLSFIISLYEARKTVFVYYIVRQRALASPIYTANLYAGSGTVPVQHRLSLVTGLTWLML